MSITTPRDNPAAPLELAGRRALVVGMARSGVAAAAFLAARGAAVTAADTKPEADWPAEALALRGRGVRLEAGPHVRESFLSADLVVVSPGVPWELAELAAAREAGVPVMAELELAWRFMPGRVVAVTGTKGKSTTTSVLGAMLTEAGFDARVGGNIGHAATLLLENATPASIFVLEVSSFQLEGCELFRPDVAVFLNLSPDHLDRHPSFEAYAAAKARIFARQTAEDWTVVNAADAEVQRLAGAGAARSVSFALEHRPGSTATFAVDGRAVLERDGVTETLFRRQDVHVPGAHLAADVLAAAAAARLLGAPPEAIARAVAAFRGIDHVLRLVGCIDGVPFYDDSKATNPEAVRVSLLAFERPLVPIMGGRSKGHDFAVLAPLAAARCKAVIAIGEARAQVARALGDHLPVVPCASLDEAVRRAWERARPDGIVVLSPGCTSFDMFRDYADRGRAFQAAVRALASTAVPAGAGELH